MESENRKKKAIQMKRGEKVSERKYTAIFVYRAWIKMKIVKFLHFRNWEFHYHVFYIQYLQSSAKWIDPLDYRVCFFHFCLSLFYGVNCIRIGYSILANHGRSLWIFRINHPFVLTGKTSPGSSAGEVFSHFLQFLPHILIRRLSHMSLPRAAIVSW